MVEAIDNESGGHKLKFWLALFDARTGQKPEMIGGGRLYCFGLVDR